MGAAGPGLQQPTCQSHLGRMSAQVLHGGSTPFLSSAGPVPLASPVSARPGDRTCRSGSSEGPVISHGPWRGRVTVAAVLAGHEGPGKSPPFQAAPSAPRRQRCAWGGAAGGAPGTALGRWCLRLGPQGGRRPTSPPPCPGPGRPGSGNQDGAEWVLPAVLYLMGEGKALPLQQPCLLRLLPIFPRSSALESLLPAAPLHALALFQRWGLGCTEA